ncbi:SDR family NAD(P)-dependent oxidoreductase [Adhaeribacter radiodurans]|uniref:Glucose 1-dehydrogenase n=1 Tax=Adhaeribacter radiodurans TaxID=2745197 RepID=A0A7L7LEP7_9BACT|nr:glucose 1-dehydrogenase [Adhaeribacter radiodurans]QMU31301.1 glucose 1-dehydrogenase [Adhaeribacter radiodurans]
MTTSPFDLSGKLALVTGGGTGLGLGIAEAFIQAGARVVITGRRLEVLQDACKQLGPMANCQVNDVADLASIPDLVQTVQQQSGPIDILVNNAGINLKKHTLEVTDAEFQAIIQTNLVGLFALTREVAKGMVERRAGSIIMITSMAAMYGLPLVTAYSASKSAVLGMTRVLASDLSPHGVRVNAIAPGFIQSPMLLKALETDPERKRKVTGRTPLGGFGQPSDIGYAAVYLASEAARFVTGINLPIDGGNSIGF